MEKMEMKTKDIVSENVEKIEEMFPNCITEGKDTDGKLKKAIDFDKLKQELSHDVVDGDEAYDFTWVGKKASMVEANTPTNKTLRPCKEESVNWDTTENLYIEGDNLEVLKILQESYLGKIKMIYIDPPYNTGNDFVYRDDFKQSREDYEEDSGEVDEEGNRLFRNTDSNGRFHSDWCSMMYSRLKLSKNIMSDDGFICVSIDDNESENLKKILDEVFGERNFRSCITVIANPGGRDYGGIAKTTEYLYVYSKTEDAYISKIKDGKHVFSMHDDIGPFELRELRNRNTVFNDKNRPNLCYPFYLNPDEEDEYGLLDVSLEEDDKHKIKVMPLVSNGIQTVWRWGKEERSRPNLNINIKGKKKQDGTYMIVEKYRDEKVMVKNFWSEKKFRTENGSIQVRNLLEGKGIFGYPKPVEIPLQILQMMTDKNDLILDFFSGSSTTAHAVMQLNAEDRGNRKYIMVQLPEETDEKSEAYKAGYKNICEIGKERIRRAAKKIHEENPEAKFDDGFRDFKLDSSNMKDVYYSADEYSKSLLDELESNIKKDRTDLDLLFGCLLDWGAPINRQYESIDIDGCKVHFYDEDVLVACFDENISDECIKEIAKRKPRRVVFRDSSFKDSPSKINVEEIFKMLSSKTTVKVI